MEKLDATLIDLRKLIRANGRQIINHLTSNYIQRDSNGKAIKNISPPICIFCSTVENITKEHIIPRWVFNKNDKAFFNIGANGQSQSYNKSTVPVCGRCNSELLNALEKQVQSIFKVFHDSKTLLDFEATENVIRWLEIIDYKFQVMNIVKRFVSPKNGRYIPFLKDYPIYMLLPNKDWSARRVISEVRWTLNRISIKAKHININSLVVFKTSNTNNHFFHNLNEFLFLEIAQYDIAVFYFYDRVFESIEEARDEAMAIIERAY